jgi:KDO2-lipid IV(A) lauroyltransferase
MNRLLYFLFIKPLSFLPFPLLFVFSKFIYFIFYYIFPYRRKVIQHNLSLAFPEWEPSKRLTYERRFKQWFSELLVEILKGFSGNINFLHKRFRFRNPAIIDQAISQGKQVVMLTSHYGNWEWGNLAMGLKYPDRVNSVYLPLKNQFWNRKFKKMRSSGGNRMIPAREVGVVMKTTRKPMIWCFVADQSPSGPAKSPWLKFMGVPAPWIDGPERLASIYDAVVVYGHIHRIGRGRYEVEFIPFEGNVDEPGAVTRFSVKELEHDLNTHPAYWLWSHRRWKHHPDKFGLLKWI